ncbi:sulfotransferase domain-containing protein [Dongia sp.]|uniref:sulfotransferase domain-containing protein n=1 Tax=Dongia sp. TaxID=1977262 RepID=UPI00375009EC
MANADQRPVVWLCGFPSSGNLKAQLGLATLLFGAPKSITELDTNIPVMSIGPQIPPCPEGFPLRFIFTHHLANRFMLTQVKTYRIVYVVRDPIDAGISSAGYLLNQRIKLGSATEAEMQATRDALIESFLDYGTYPEYVSYDYGTWSSHVLSWLTYAQEARVEMMVVKFDDMRHRGAEVLGELAKFVGIKNLPDGRIEQALESWSLKASALLEENAIRNQERSRFFKPAWAPAYAQGWRYHGKGLSGYGKDRLSPAQWERARHLFGPAAAKIGLEMKFSA